MYFLIVGVVKLFSFVFSMLTFSLIQKYVAARGGRIICGKNERNNNTRLVVINNYSCRYTQATIKKKVFFLFSLGTGACFVLALSCHAVNVFWTEFSTVYEECVRSLCMCVVLCIWVCPQLCKPIDKRANS